MSRREGGGGGDLDLVEQREYLLRSIADLDRERAAGDVTEEDYASLRAIYVERAATTLRAIEAATTTGDGTAPADAGSRWSRLRRALGRRRTRRLLGVTGTLLLVVGLGLTAASLAGVRLPGETATGSVSIPTSTRVAQQLVEASEFANAGEIAEAITLYDVVLSEVPNQADALTYRGWLERLAGLRARSPSTVRAGDASLAAAVVASPGYADARALYGIALYEDDHATSRALGEFRAFLADHPTSALLTDLGGEMASAFAGAHEAIPKALRAYVGHASSSVLPPPATPVHS